MLHLILVKKNDSPTISKMLANKIIFLVACVLSDQWPNSGPDRRPLKLNADSAKPRKYGAASKVCKYRHIVGNITAGDGEVRAIKIVGDH